MTKNTISNTDLQKVGWVQVQESKHIFCVIHGINNYVQINTNWSYMVRIGWQVTYFCWRLKDVSLLAKGKLELVWIVEPGIATNLGTFLYHSHYSVYLTNKNGAIKRGHNCTLM
jgi:hypothetical protein